MHDLPLRTPDLVLRHFVAADAADTLRLNAEPTTAHWLPSHVYADLAEAQARLAFLIAACADPGHPLRGPYVLAVEHRDSSHLLGHVGFSPLDGDVEVSYAIAEAARGRGYGTQALAHACAWAAHTHALARIVAVTAAANLASRKVLERARFARVGDAVMRFQGALEQVSRYVWQPEERDGGDAGPR